MLREPDRWLALVLAVIICTTGSSLTLLSVQQEDARLRSDLLSEAKIAVLTIDPARVEALAGSPADLASPEYTILKDRMVRIRASDPAIRFTYLLGQRPDGTIFFYGDSEPPGSEDYSPPGQVYEEATVLIRTAFSKNEAQTGGPDTDRWGTWVSSVVPVTDRQTGKLIAVFGMDIDAKDWNRNLFVAAVPGILGTLLVLVLLVSFSLIYRRSKRQKQRLEISEKAYRAIFEYTGSATIQVEEDSTISRVNSSFELLTGYSRSEIEGRKKWTEFIHPDDLPQMKEYHRLRREPGSQAPSHYEFRLITRDGKEKEILLSVGLIPGTDRSIASLFDLTEKKELERAVQESEEHYQQLFELANDGITIVRDGVILRCNAAFGSITGYPLDELITQSMEKVIHPDDREVVMDRHWRRLSGEKGLPEITTFRLIAKDGTVRWVELNTRVIAWGQKPATLNIVRDITGRKEIEMALQESNSRYRLILQSANDAILIHETSREGPGRLIEVNEQACRMLGYTREELLGMNTSDIDVAEQKEQYDRIQEQLYREGTVVFQTEQVTRDRRRVPVEVSARLVELEGKPAVLSIVRDLTGQKRTERVLLEVNKKLNLLNTITRHDVLNQLLVLKGYIELSQQFLHDKEKLQLYTARVLETITTIEHQILFARDYQDMGIRAPVWQNVRILVINAKGALPMRNVTVVQEGTSIDVLADPLLAKVFYNLIDNALRHGGEKLTAIRVSTSVRDDGLAIIVEDDGMGIPDKDKQKLFIPGFGKNTGFGLFLSREILSITGITIEETGTPGRGARFEIRVPASSWRRT